MANSNKDRNFEQTFYNIMAVLGVIAFGFILGKCIIKLAEICGYI